MTNIEHDEYLQVWSLDAESALRMFGYSSITHDVVVLKNGPRTERETAKYRADAKMFGIKVKVAP